jgi:hypothetical protein
MIKNITVFSDVTHSLIDAYPRSEGMRCPRLQDGNGSF